MAKAMQVGCNDGKDLCKHVQSGVTTKVEDKELIMGVPHCETEKLIMLWVDVNMEVGILHIENR